MTSRQSTIDPQANPDPKTSIDYFVKPIFDEPKQLYGREREVQVLQSCFHRLMDDTVNEQTDGEDKVKSRDRDENSPTVQIVPSGSNDDTSECNSSGLGETTNSQDAPKRQTTGKLSKLAPHIRHSIKQASDISIEYEKTFLCHAPQTRECVLLYGAQGTGKRSLTRHALGTLVRERGGWLLGGDFERDYFGGGGRSGRRSTSEGGNKRGVRFADEKSHDEDGMSSAIPLSGVIAVCREICAKLLEMRDAESAGGKGTSGTSLVTADTPHLFQDTVEMCAQSLSLEERQLLVKSLGLSQLKPILEIKDSDKSDYCEATIDNVLHHKKKLHYSFQKFFSVICQFHGPLVIYFNNFQYADDASLDLLESLLFDREIGKLMIVGCVQLPDQGNGTNEYVPLADRMSKKLHAKIDQWKDEDGKLFGLNVTDIELNNLSLDSTKQILMDMLSIKDNSNNTKQMLMNMISKKGNITSLADLCYEYSHGNAYFLKKFMEMLHKKKLLYKDHASDKWSWDLYDVTSVITSSNVVEVIVSESANKLPKQAKSLLLLAICMGSTYIDEDILFRVWSKFERKSRSNDDVQSQFRLYINESLYRKVLVKVHHPFADRRAYHWADESMIKALSGHVDPHNIASLRYEIGSTLDHGLAEEADVLIIANLVNSGGNSLLGSLDSKKRVQWAKKNLVAAKKAVVMSAFDSASRYAEAGIAYLPSSMRWKEHCTLMLELASILGEVAGALGKLICFQQVTAFYF